MVSRGLARDSERSANDGADWAILQNLKRKGEKRGESKEGIRNQSNGRWRNLPEKAQG